MYQGVQYNWQQSSRTLLRLYTNIKPNSPIETGSNLITIALFPVARQVATQVFFRQNKFRADSNDKICSVVGLGER